VIQNGLEIKAKDTGKADYLKWPAQEIESHYDAKDKGKQDIHLVFEYRENESILGGRFTAPRSNRFYFVHDPNGGKFLQLEPYHKIIKDSYPEIKRHMYGGYQLLQKLSIEDAETRLKKE